MSLLSLQQGRIQERALERAALWVSDEGGPTMIEGNEPENFES